MIKGIMIFLACMQAIYAFQPECENSAYGIGANSCTRFYVCVMSRIVKMECPDQKHFDVKLGKCVLPEESDCQAKADFIGGGIEWIINPHRPSHPEHPKFPHWPEFPEFPEWPEFPEFPEWPEFPEFPHFPHNPHKPTTYRPTTSKPTTVKPITVPPTTTKQTTTEPTTIHPTTTEVSTTQSKPENEVKCPTENGPVPVFHRHQTDCTKYYICDWGHPFMMDCPAGLHFNADLNVCDWPANANCLVTVN
ncbi:PREDICTED: probable chitinase 3 [Nicrophorus vespilloides]|uniref:Probable chitinase 3 n=1 Tax=Nicrophorus vespilloides TaxID=110193 RepID=A0ABM1MWA7_NICVS|nr:PREDICTED: probable chitinase 3 [Nicrophorus vespilloides]